MNKVIANGRLTRDVDFTTVGQDLAKARFTLAVRRDYLQKGSRIAIEGRWQTGKYDADDGRTVYTNDAVVDRIEFLDTRKQDDTANVDPYTGKASQGADPFANDGKSINIDDLPF
jgi:single-strand DNA-binding protein